MPSVSRFEFADRFGCEGREADPDTVGALVQSEFQDPHPRRLARTHSLAKLVAHGFKITDAIAHSIHHPDAHASLRAEARDDRIERGVAHRRKDFERPVAGVRKTSKGTGATDPQFFSQRAEQHAPGLGWRWTWSRHSVIFQ